LNSNYSIKKKDFIDKANLLINSLRGVFPNIQILENKDKLTRLENFDVNFKFNELFIIALYRRNWK